MLDLFRLETDSQVQVLTAGLLALEQEPTASDQLEACMRAAHSLKGAARIVGIDVGVDIAHVMEDSFVAAQRGTVELGQAHIDVLLGGVDLLHRIAGTSEANLAQWQGDKHEEVARILADLKGLLELPSEEGRTEPATVSPPLEPVVAAPPAANVPADIHESQERVLRVTADHLNRLLGLTGEALVESRWLQPFVGSLLKLKRLHYELGKSIESLHEALPEQAIGERARLALGEVRHRALQSHQLLAQHLGELEMFDHRSSNLAHRLYSEALACRMRPFADGVRGLPRMVRDVARSLGKQVRLEVIGESTQVDRDILEKLEPPLGHLVRNAIDHGIGFPEERLAIGKPAEGRVTLEARHSGGMLQIHVSDDGRGIDLEQLREAVLQRNLTNAETAAKLSENELLEFLFLPGFTMKDSVTDISGRGVGLDVVQTMIKQVRGTIRVSTQPRKGVRFQLMLPLSLSVVRALVADIGGEPYAFPLAAIVRTLKLPKNRIDTLEGRQFFVLDGRSVGLISAHQLLQSGEPVTSAEDLSVIVVGDGGGIYGLAVDRLLGEHELVVRSLDARLRKVKDITAGALLEDGSPALIVDVADLLRSVEKLITNRGLNRLRTDGDTKHAICKRILVIDDSLTVRELERALLSNAGYEVEVAVDGMEGWNTLRTGRYDLVVTDIDMPRMDGIELVALIKRDPHLSAIPVLIVSYKDREEDRQRGLEAGADYYLAKGSFHDESLLQAVADLIGEATP